MQRMFVNNLDEDVKVLTRNRAKGYKELHIGADTNDNVDIVTEGNTLKVVKNPNKDTDDHCTVILCKEFGLVGYKSDFVSDVSILFLDNGYLLLTLYKGAVVVKDGNIARTYSVGVSDVPKVIIGADDIKTNILWVNSNQLLSYMQTKYFGKVKANMPYDFEFRFFLSGGVTNDEKTLGLSSFSLKMQPSEDKDISLGAALEYEKKLETLAMETPSKEVMYGVELDSYDRVEGVTMDSDDDEEDEYDDEDEDFEEEDDE